MYPLNIRYKLYQPNSFHIEICGSCRMTSFAALIKNDGIQTKKFFELKLRTKFWEQDGLADKVSMH